MATLILGGAGFIGSHLVDRLVEGGEHVTVVDDLSSGREAFLAGALATGHARLERFEVTSEPGCVDRLAAIVAGHARVLHLAANPDARRGLVDTLLDLRQNTLTTWAALEASRRAGVATFVLASSGTVYGEVPVAADAPEGAATEAAGLDEDHGPCLPISPYGASKVAAEALVSAFAHALGVRGVVLRFGNVVGPRATHGVIHDLVDKLRRDPTELEVLGDGKQRKPYLHVDDCVAGMLHVLAAVEAGRVEGSLARFNLAPPDTTSVAQIAAGVVEAMGLAATARVRFTGGDRGWPGDVPRSVLSPERLARLGFRVSLGSDAAVRRATREIVREKAG